MDTLWRLFNALGFFFLFCVGFFPLQADEKRDVSYSWGLYAVDISTGKVLLSQNEDRLFVPASSLKVMVSAAALHYLGPEFRFQTKLAYEGQIVRGVLQGNLYIMGGGDPCLGSSRVLSSLSSKALFDSWIEALKIEGIQKIQGKVIPLISFWETALAPPSWSWEDLGNYYGSGASILSFQENQYSMTLRPGKEEGDPSEIVSFDPLSSQLQVKNEVVTGKKGSGDLVCLYGVEYGNVQYARGSIPKDEPFFIVKGAIPNPPAFCVERFCLQMKTSGIEISEETIPCVNPKVFHHTFSPPLKEIVKVLLRDSVNLYAEHLLKKIGEIEQGFGSTDGGLKAVKKFLDHLGIDMKGSILCDGSGLSRKNLISPRQMVSFLLKMKGSSDVSCFESYLVPCSFGGRGKTGSMSQIRSYAGYYKNVAFAFFINNCSSSDVLKEKVNSILLDVSHLKLD